MDQCPALTSPQNLAEVFALLDSLDTPQRVREFEELVLQFPQIDLQTHHIVHGGVYMRSVHIPAGAFLTGALTKCDNLCILVGDIVVTTDHGPQRLTGHHVLPARAGYKRVGVALADTWWAMSIGTPLTDVRAIEDSLTDEAERLQTRRPDIAYMPLDQLDYEVFVAESGIPPELIARAMAYTDDLTETPECFTHLYRSKSTIHGDGLFAKHDIPCGRRIAPMQVEGMRAVAGRWTNHAKQPNAEMVRTAAGLDLHAIRDIRADEEVTIDYRQALRVNNILEFAT